MTETVEWIGESFLVSETTDITQVLGYTFRGLGLCSQNRSLWRLIHLGTGHLVAQLYGDWRAVSRAATELALAGEWEFLSLEGWRDRFPDVETRLRAWNRRHPGLIVVHNGASQPPNESHARDIARTRP